MLKVVMRMGRGEVVCERMVVGRKKVERTGSFMYAVEASQQVILRGLVSALLVASQRMLVEQDSWYCRGMG
jgi:hypothetical protein